MPFAMFIFSQAYSTTIYCKLRVSSVVITYCWVIFANHKPHYHHHTAHIIFATECVGDLCRLCQTGRVWFFLFLVLPHLAGNQASKHTCLSLYTQYGYIDFSAAHFGTVAKAHPFIGFSLSNFRDKVNSSLSIYRFVRAGNMARAHAGGGNDDDGDMVLMCV